jgi:hypothetical protein
MTPEQLRNRLEEMAKASGPAVSNIAKVKSVDQDKAICVLEDEDGQEIPAVRLRPVLNGKKSFLQIPKVGTYVLAIRIEDDEDWMVIACDEVDKVIWYVGSTTFQMDDTGFLLKKENETLKKLMVDLIGACKNLSLSVTTTGTATNQAGTTTAVLNLAEFVAIETRFNQFLK